LWCSVSFSLSGPFPSVSNSIYFLTLGLDQIQGVMPSVTRPQIQSSYKMEQVAKIIANDTGKRIRYVEPEFSHARLRLREFLCLPDIYE
ncbi:MAG: hypothetical protein ACOYD7_03360, partial [Raoultibacter sp.]